MAQASRRTRREQRTKRNASILGRTAIMLVEQASEKIQAFNDLQRRYLQTHQALLNVLVQVGGTVILSRGTRARVQDRFEEWKWKVSVNPADASEVIVEASEPEVPEPAVPVEDQESAS